VRPAEGRVDLDRREALRIALEMASRRWKRRQEPTAAWGLMLQGGAEEYASTAPWIAVFPGAAIALTVFGFSLFGDALRDVLDPRLRDR
jgi:ABC-type antimicrobial peptide transport system permease subunit